MVDDNSIFDEDESVFSVIDEKTLKVLNELKDRCATGSLTLEEVKNFGEESYWRVGMKSGRETRSLLLGSYESISAFMAIPFEKYIFLNDHDAICSYEDKYIEAVIRPLNSGILPSRMAICKLFGGDASHSLYDLQQFQLNLDSGIEGYPKIEISQASDVIMRLIRSSTRNVMTIKLTGCMVATHDQALQLLIKTAGSIFFQIDLLAEVTFALRRQRKPHRRAKRADRRQNISDEIQYPKSEFDDSPLALYWYASSASEMPLLQFLAFYQVIEFYFPVYSRSEAQRKIKAILKDPTFRAERDTDIGKVLSAIHISRGGAFGDEKSQLKSTIMECVDPDALREYFESDPDRKEFYSTKTKKSSYHKIPLSSSITDFRNDVSERLYELRCKIVHTKNDSRDGEVDLLLPFSKEAEQLSFDIELVRYVAQRTLIAGSRQYNVNE